MRLCMGLRCRECGEVFGEDEMKTVRADYGEFWGAPCVVDEQVCPYCLGGGIEEYYEDDEDESESEEEDE